MAETGNSHHARKPTPQPHLSIRVFEELRADDASADNVSVVKEALAQLGLAPRAVRPP
jgi:hypothetical protein